MKREHYIGTPTLVLLAGKPWYSGIVIAVTCDGQFAEVKETGTWFPRCGWHEVKDLRAIGELNPWIEEQGK